MTTPATDHSAACAQRGPGGRAGGGGRQGGGSARLRSAAAGRQAVGARLFLGAPPHWCGEQRGSNGLLLRHQHSILTR